MIVDFHTQIAALAPIDGISINEDTGLVDVQFSASATAQQRANALALASTLASGIAAAKAAESAEIATYTADKVAFKGAINTAITRLTQINDTASPTNAQVIAAVRDLATYELHIIKALRRML